MSHAAGIQPVSALAPDLADRLRKRLSASPALSWLEPTLEELDLDYCVLGVRYRPELTNGSPAIHGGVLATLADTAVAFALSTNFDGKMGFATADLTIHFLARAKSDVRARARILKKGRRVNVGEVDVVDADDRPVARALTTYLLTTSSFEYLPEERR
ncbi:MAG TPA: PaaI family thioesterase [Thermoanaerobaculia bacterium]|nr:PaaI family thioesterase [Thermoanaerobaculia bacterium]